MSDRNALYCGHSMRGMLPEHASIGARIDAHEAASFQGPAVREYIDRCLAQEEKEEYNPALSTFTEFMESVGATVVERPDTLVVNLFGGPGTGKSTTAASVFAKLKQLGVKAEIVHEFAKDLVWEERHKALSFQPYILGKQAYHVHRLLGNVEVVITDSPILLSSHIYCRENAGYDVVGLQQMALGIFDDWNTLDIFLRRDLDIHPFEAAGRNQDEQEAVQLDADIEAMLEHLAVVYCDVPVLPGDATADQIVNLIGDHLA